MKMEEIPKTLLKVVEKTQSLQEDQRSTQRHVRALDSKLQRVLDRSARQESLSVQREDMKARIETQVS